MLEKCLVMLRLRASMRRAGDDGRPGSSKIMFVAVYTSLSSFRFCSEYLCQGSNICRGQVNRRLVPHSNTRPRVLCESETNFVTPWTSIKHFQIYISLAHGNFANLTRNG